ncbi:MAG: hypothetical protein FWH29_05140 [Methanobrevibacter sp.]|nr:hypothetical protein [Methanobrevibacter sp.]
MSNDLINHKNRSFISTIVVALRRFSMSQDNKQKFRMCMLIVIALLFLFSLQSTTAADQSITTTDSGGILNAIDLVDPGETIFLAPGTYTGSNNTGITINKNLTIIGNNSIIDGQSQSRIFTIDYDISVNFINITFVNGKVDIVYDSYGYPMDSEGGAIYSFGTKVNVIGCTFINNSASSGGAIYNYYGSELAIENSTFINNTAEIDYGGAISNLASNFYMNNLNFINNHANLSGGAIYNFAINFQANSSNFANNHANYLGGAIYNTGSSFTISNSVFSDNTASDGGGIYNNGYNLVIANSVFYNNSASNNGGGFYNRATNLDVMDSNFTINKAINGGAIYNFVPTNIVPVSFGIGIAPLSTAIYSFNMGNSIFDSNLATNNGGAIYNNDTQYTTIDYPVTIDTSYFVNNTAVKGGGIYNVNGSYFGARNSNFTSNNAVEGAAIYNYYSSNFGVENSNFNDNTASEKGAIYNYNGTNFSVKNSNSNNNTAIEGGTVYNYYGANFVVENSNFNNNTASDGGAVYNYYGNVFTVNSSTFSNNSGILGGGVFTNGINSQIRNSNFTNNTQAIALAITEFTLMNNIISENGIGVQFVFNNLNYSIAGLSANNNIYDNDFAIGISGNSSNYTVNDVFGLANNGGFIFTSTANNNAILNAHISNYSRTGSWAIFFAESSNNNSVISSNITNNLNAIGINGGNNKVVGSNIINNNLGIHVLSLSSNALINYNRIFNNSNSNGFDMLNSGINTNANLNWWGDNTPLVSSIVLANWFVMELSAKNLTNNFKTTVNTTVYQSNGTVELSYEFLLIDGATGVTSLVDYDALPSFLINLIWNSNTGIIYNSANVSGKGKYSQNVTLTLNNWFSIQAIGDNSDIILFLEPDMSNIVNLTITKGSNVTGNATIDDLVLYTITVTNNGPANATGLIISDVLDYRLIFESASGGTYTLIGNTLIWNIGTLNDGAAVTLFITVRINGTGLIVNIANVTSLNQENIGNKSSEETSFEGNPLSTNIHVENITQKATQVFTINGTVNSASGRLVNGFVDITINGTLFSNVPVINGKFALTLTYYVYGFYSNLTVVYSGDETFESSNTSGWLNITPVTTTISVRNESVFIFNRSTDFTAILLDEWANPLSGAQVEFWINGINVANHTTNGNGRAVYGFNPGLDPSIHNITVIYSGNGTYLDSSNLTLMVPKPLETFIVIENKSDNKPFKDVIIYLKFVDELGNPIVNITLNVTLNGVIYQEITTDANGRALIYYYTNVSGIATFGVAPIPISLLRPDLSPPIISEGIVRTDPLDTTINLRNIVVTTFQSAAFSFLLIDEDGRLLANKGNIIISLDGVQIGGYHSSDAFGRVYVDAGLLPLGVYNITANFPGNPHTWAPVTSVRTLTVRLTRTTVFVSAIYNGTNSTSFVAKLHDAENNKILSGKSIIFFLNGKYIGMAVTDHNGIAILNYSYTLGGNIAAEFLGDNNYREYMDNRTFGTTDIILSDPEPNDNPESIEDPTDLDTPEDIDDPNLNPVVAMLKTGNPIAIIFLCLLSMFFLGFISKRKD